MDGSQHRNTTKSTRRIFNPDRPMHSATPGNAAGKDHSFKSANFNHVENRFISQTDGKKLSNQSYSSRNSLRSAQSSSIEDKGTNPASQSDKMQSYHNGLDDRIPDPYLENIANYHQLTCESFLKVVGGYIYCVLCDIRERYSEEAANNHLDSEHHLNNYRKLRKLLVDEIPDDTSLHMSAVSELLQKWLNGNCLRDDQVHTRQMVMQEFNHIVAAINPQCRCRLLGSLANGTSLVTSDINLELMHPNSKLFESDPRAKNSIHHKLIEPDAEHGRQINYHTIHYDLAPNALEALHKIRMAIEGGFCRPESDSFQLTSTLSDLNRRVPRLTLLHITSQIKLDVICYAQAQYRLSRLLKLYIELDCRAKYLSLLIKHWAKICGIDKPDHGTYPPETFVILVIYYLQRVSPPVLPCLHEFNSRTHRVDQGNSWNQDSQSTSQLGQSSLIDEEVNNAHLLINNNGLENVPDQVNELEEEVDEEEEDSSFLNLDDSDINSFEWSSENTESVTRLFIGFMQFMFEEFKNVANVISIRTLKNVTVASKGWKTSVKGIEDPVKPRVNISRCLGTSRAFVFIRECFQNAFYYLTSIPLDSKMNCVTDKQIDPSDYIELYFNAPRLNFYFSMRERILGRKNNVDTIKEMIQQSIFSRDVEVVGNLREKVQEFQLATVLSNFYKNELLVPNDSASTTYCWLCKRFGHIRFTCPKSKRESLHGQRNDNRGLDDQHLDSKFLEPYFRDKIGPRLARTHLAIVSELTRIINRATKLDCVLQLFGSTVNQLGSFDSDLDICMVIAGNATGKGIDCVSVLQKVEAALQNEKRIHSIEAILTARVPIIRFKFDSFDVDLSMYNRCAIHNSLLLKKYAEIDERVAQLFYSVKRFAKICDIADASKGSLSSYAWALLVIHYLQRTDPPILPVLQEVPRGFRKPMVGVNGWNVWFDGDAGPMPLPNYSGITQLFKGFFYYYGSFDYELEVISIRQRQSITRFQKNWNNCPIAIEDPFELTYNLACRLDESMGIFIINSFAQAFKHISSLQEEYLNCGGNRSIVDRIFEWRDITGSKPPYRGCKICHRVGHKRMDCPIGADRRRRNRTRDRIFQN